MRKQRLHTKKLNYAKQESYKGVSDSARCAKPLRNKNKTRLFEQASQNGTGH